jgi:hypothetical protein
MVWTKSAAVEANAGTGERRALLGRGVIFAGTAPLESRDYRALPATLAVRENVVRTVGNSSGQLRASGARTPHHLVNGTITPNGLT